MAEKAIAKLTIEEYLAFEATAEVRHEYHNGEVIPLNGEVFAMAGGTFNHSILGNTVNTELNIICREKPCVTFNGDMKIRIEVSNRYLYPEAAVVCGEVELSLHEDHSITNPVLVVEVLSDTSEAYDRGEKFRLYRKLPSFREYVMIDQHRPVVSIFYRKKDNIWEMREVTGLDTTFHLQSLDADIKMADLYRNTKDLKGLWEE